MQHEDLILREQEKEMMSGEKREESSFEQLFCGNKKSAPDQLSNNFHQRQSSREVRSNELGCLFAPPSIKQSENNNFIFDSAEKDYSFIKNTRIPSPMMQDTFQPSAGAFSYENSAAKSLNFALHLQESNEKEIQGERAFVYGQDCHNSQNMLLERSSELSASLCPSSQSQDKSAQQQVKAEEVDESPSKIGSLLTHSSQKSAGNQLRYSSQRDGCGFLFEQQIVDEFPRGGNYYAPTSLLADSDRKRQNLTEDTTLQLIKNPSLNQVHQMQTNQQPNQHIFGCSEQLSNLESNNFTYSESGGAGSLRFTIAANSTNLAASIQNGAQGAGVSTSIPRNKGTATHSNNMQHHQQVAAVPMTLNFIGNNHQLTSDCGVIVNSDQMHEEHGAPFDYLQANSQSGSLCRPARNSHTIRQRSKVNMVQGGRIHHKGQNSGLTNDDLNIVELDQSEYSPDQFKKGPHATGGEVPSRRLGLNYQNYESSIFVVPPEQQKQGQLIRGLQESNFQQFAEDDQQNGLKEEISPFKELQQDHQCRADDLDYQKMYQIQNFIQGGAEDTGSELNSQERPFHVAKDLPLLSSGQDPPNVLSQKTLNKQQVAPIDFVCVQSDSVKITELQNLSSEKGQQKQMDQRVQKGQKQLLTKRQLDFSRMSKPETLLYKVSPRNQQVNGKTLKEELEDNDPQTDSENQNPNQMKHLKEIQQEISKLLDLGKSSAQMVGSTIQAGTKSQKRVVVKPYMKNQLAPGSLSQRQQHLHVFSSHSSSATHSNQNSFGGNNFGQIFDPQNKKIKIDYPIVPINKDQETNISAPISRKFKGQSIVPLLQLSKLKKNENAINQFSQVGSQQDDDPNYCNNLDQGKQRNLIRIREGIVSNIDQINIHPSKTPKVELKQTIEVQPAFQAKKRILLDGQSQVQHEYADQIGSLLGQISAQAKKNINIDFSEIEKACQSKKGGIKQRSKAKSSSSSNLTARAPEQRQKLAQRKRSLSYKFVTSPQDVGAQQLSKANDKNISLSSRVQNKEKNLDNLQNEAICQIRRKLEQLKQKRTNHESLTKNQLSLGKIGSVARQQFTSISTVKSVEQMHEKDNQQSLIANKQNGTKKESCLSQIKSFASIKLTDSEVNVLADTLKKVQTTQDVQQISMPVSARQPGKQVFKKSTKAAYLKQQPQVVTSRSKQTNLRQNQTKKRLQNEGGINNARVSHQRQSAQNKEPQFKVPGGQQIKICAKSKESVTVEVAPESKPKLQSSNPRIDQQSVESLTEHSRSNVTLGVGAGVGIGGNGSTKTKSQPNHLSSFSTKKAPSVANLNHPDFQKKLGLLSEQIDHGLCDYKPNSDYYQNKAQQLSNQESELVREQSVIKNERRNGSVTSRKGPQKIISSSRSSVVVRLPVKKTKSVSMIQNGPKQNCKQLGSLGSQSKQTKSKKSLAVKSVKASGAANFNSVSKEGQTRQVKALKVVKLSNNNEQLGDQIKIESQRSLPDQTNVVSKRKSLLKVASQNNQNEKCVDVNQLYQSETELPKKPSQTNSKVKKIGGPICQQLTAQNTESDLEIQNGDTLLSYRDWLKNQITQATSVLNNQKTDKNCLRTSTDDKVVSNKKWLPINQLSLMLKQKKSSDFSWQDIKSKKVCEEDGGVGNSFQAKKVFNQKNVGSSTSEPSLLSIHQNSTDISRFNGLNGVERGNLKGSGVAVGGNMGGVSQGGVLAQQQIVQPVLFSSETKTPAAPASSSMSSVRAGNNMSVNSHAINLIQGQKFSSQKKHQNLSLMSPRITENSSLFCPNLGKIDENTPSFYSKMITNQQINNQQKHKVEISSNTYHKTNNSSSLTAININQNNKKRQLNKLNQQGTPSQVVVQQRLNTESGCLVGVGAIDSKSMFKKEKLNIKVKKGGVGSSQHIVADKQQFSSHHPSQRYTADDTICNQNVNKQPSQLHSLSSINSQSVTDLSMQQNQLQQIQSDLLKHKQLLSFVTKRGEIESQSNQMPSASALISKYNQVSKQTTSGAISTFKSNSSRGKLRSVQQSLHVRMNSNGIDNQMESEKSAVARAIVPSVQGTASQGKPETKSAGKLMSKFGVNRPKTARQNQFELAKKELRR